MLDDLLFINNLIIDYLHTFANFKDWELIQSWNGIYPKMMNGQTELIVESKDEREEETRTIGGGSEGARKMGLQVQRRQKEKTEEDAVMVRH